MPADPPDRNGTPGSDTRHKEDQEMTEVDYRLEGNPAAAKLLEVIHDPTYQITTDAESERFQSLLFDTFSAALLTFFKDCEIRDLIDLVETASEAWNPDRIFELTAALVTLAKQHPQYNRQEDPHVLP